MAYEKRMCVMKQLKKGFSPDGSDLSGVVYAEKLGDTLTVIPRLAGLSPLKEGRYVLAVRAEERTAFFELNGNEPLKTPFPASLRAGFSALLCFVRGEAEGIAYGACGVGSSPEALLLSLTESEKKKRPANPNPPYEIPVPGSPAPVAPGVPVPGPSPEEPFRYDDEAIAASDYYADGGGEGESLPQEEETDGGGHPPADAPAPLLPRGSLTYYHEVRERLRTAFETFPPDTSLKEVFPLSEWVKTEAALLGVIYEQGLPRYLCVAVKKEGEPPEDMKRDCTFVPVFPGDGYYIVFHDADTGEPVHLKES